MMVIFYLISSILFCYFIYNSDKKHKEIYNIDCIGLLLSSIGALSTTNFVLDYFLLIFTLLFILGGFILYLKNKIGGGDLKLLLASSIFIYSYGIILLAGFIINILFVLNRIKTETENIELQKEKELFPIGGYYALNLLIINSMILFFLISIIVNYG